MEHHALRFRAVFHLPVSGIGTLLTVKRLGNGGGDEEHPVHVGAALAQGLARGEAFDHRLAVLPVPLQVHIQVNPLAVPVVRGTEEIRIPGDHPSVLPVGIQHKILIRQIAHALQPVLQLLVDLLASATAQFNGLHVPLPPSASVWPWMPPAADACPGPAGTGRPGRPGSPPVHRPRTAPPAPAGAPSGVCACS